MIDDHKTLDECKMQDSEETRTMHTKSDNIEVLIDNETDEIIEELFKSLLQKFQKITNNQ